MKLGGATLAEALKKWSKGVWVVDELRFLKGPRRQYGIGPLVDRKLTSALNDTVVSVHKAPHLLCCRAFEVRKYVCAPDALHLRHPVNAYNEVV